MAASNRLELEITATDKTSAAASSAKRQFGSVEQEAVRAARSASRQTAGLDRSIAAFERQAATFGLRGIERFRARADALRQAAGAEEAAVQRIIAAQNRLEQRERARGSRPTVSRGDYAYQQFRLQGLSGIARLDAEERIALQRFGSDPARATEIRERYTREAVALMRREEAEASASRARAASLHNQREVARVRQMAADREAATRAMQAQRAQEMDALRLSAVAASRRPTAGAVAFQDAFGRVQQRDAGIRELERRAAFSRARTPLAELNLQERLDLGRLGTNAAAAARVRAAYADMRAEVLRNHSALDRFGDTAMSAGVRMAPISIAMGLGARQAINMASAIESAKVAFTGMLGSRGAADAFVNTLQVFAAKTPFNFQGLVDQSRWLLTAGFKPNEILPTLSAYGDAVAAFGGGDPELNRVLLQLGQMKLKRKVNWEDLKLMSQAGIPAIDILSKSIQKPGESMDAAAQRTFKMLEQGKFAADSTLNLLLRELILRYGGQMVAQSATLKGQLSNLKDQSDITFGAIGNGMKDTTGTFITGARTMLKWVQDLADGFAQLPAPIRHAGVTIAGLGIAAPGVLFFLGSLASAGPIIAKGWQGVRAVLAGFTALQLGATLTTAASGAVLFAQAVAMIAAAFGGWTAGKWIRDITGLGGAVDRFWSKDGMGGKIAGRFGYITDPSQLPGVVGDDKYFVQLYRDRLQRKGLKLPAQGSMDDATYLQMLKSLAATYGGPAGGPGAGGGDDDAKKLESDRKRAADILQQSRNREFTGLADVFATYRGNLSDVGTSPAARRDLASALNIDIQREARKELSKGADEALKAMGEESASKRDFDIRRYQEELKFREDTIQMDVDTAARRLALEQDALEDLRALRLQDLDAVQAQTVASKLAVEDAKLTIEQDYAARSLGIQISKLEAERDAALLSTMQKSILGYEIDPVTKQSVPVFASGLDRQLAAINAQYDQQIAAARDAATVKELQRTRQTAIEKARIEIEENRRVFDSFKNQAGTLLDQIFSRTRNFGDAVKGVLRAAFLTPFKEAASNQIAAGMMRLLGQDVRLEAATVTGTGPLAGIRRLFARLGVGAQPRFGGNTIEDVRLVNNSVPVWIMNGAQAGQQAAQNASRSMPGGSGSLGRLAGVLGGGAGAAIALGGLFGGGSASGATGSVVSSVITDGMGNIIGGGSTTGIFGGASSANPMIFHAAGNGSVAGLGPQFSIPFGGGAAPGAGGAAAGNAAGAAGMLGGLKGFFGFGSSSVGWAGKATTTATMGGKLTALGTSPAALLGGAALIGMGLKRGGLSGLGMTAAGGALIGFKYGGPIGAVIGGIAGAVAGTVRLFMKSAEEKAREKIRSAYGLDVKDKGLLKQIVQMSKDSFGGNLDMAIRSPQIRELLELYAMSTGQGFGTQAKVRPVSLMQDAGGISQNPYYENGRALAFTGAFGTRTSADIIPGNPGGVGYATNFGAGPVVVQSVVQLDYQATTDFMHGKTAESLDANPRMAQSAVNKAQRGNYGRREQAAQMTHPGLILS